MSADPFAAPSGSPARRGTDRAGTSAPGPRGGDPWAPTAGTTTAGATTARTGAAGTGAQAGDGQDRPLPPAQAQAPVSARAEQAAAPGEEQRTGDEPGEGGEGKGAAKGSRTRGMAVEGRPASVPEHQQPPRWAGPASRDEDYAPDEDFDAKDLSDVNRELNRCRARLFRVSGFLREAQRAAADADLAYRRQMRRALVQISGGSAETRKAMAELQCEAFENDLVVATQVAEEWKKRSMDARDDLKAVENLAHNVRAQMDIR